MVCRVTCPWTNRCLLQPINWLILLLHLIGCVLSAVLHVLVCVYCPVCLSVSFCAHHCNQSPDLYHGWLAVLPFCRGMLLHYELRSRRQWRVSAGYSNHLLRCQVNNPAKALSVVYHVCHTLHLVVYCVQLTI